MLLLHTLGTKINAVWFYVVSRSISVKLMLFGNYTASFARVRAIVAEFIRNTNSELVILEIRLCLGSSMNVLFGEIGDLEESIDQSITDGWMSRTTK